MWDSPSETDKHSNILSLAFFSRYLGVKDWRILSVCFAGDFVRRPRTVMAHKMQGDKRKGVEKEGGRGGATARAQVSA